MQHPHRFACLALLSLLQACGNAGEPGSSTNGGSTTGTGGTGQPATGGSTGPSGAGGTSAGATNAGGSTQTGGSGTNTTGGSSTPNGGGAGTPAGGNGVGGAGAGMGGGSMATGGTSAGATGVGGSGGVGGMTGTGGATSGGGSGLPEPTRVTIAGPIVKVDFDMAGRPTTEVSELNYTAWPITAGPSATATYQGIKFTVEKAGTNGVGVKSDWQKLAVQIPNYARLVGDGVTIDGGEAGGQLQLTISGLSAGKHSMLAFLNQTANVASAAPIDITVDGASKATGVVPSIQALSNAAAKSAYFQFDAVAGKDVVVLFKAQTSSSAVNKNVMLNGFDLNVPDPAGQATLPKPADGDEHVDCDKGSVTLSWKGASGAASHDVYISNDPKVLETATRSSPAFKANQTGTSYNLASTDSLKTYYWRVDEITSGNVATTGSIWYFRPRHLAFPGAEGYGRFARGGRGGVVVHVTNLNDTGPGSLRDAITTDRGPRTVVFDVGGVIKLASRLTVSQNYITVAGQTAPGKGIVIRSAPFGASGVHDLIIQNVRVRLGGGTTFDGMGLQGSDFSIVDHCSISWTIDEAFSSRSGKNITLQRTLISECLNIAGHQNYPEGTAHGYAASISGDVGSFHHNLLSHCEGRNWSLAGGLDGAGEFAGRLDIFNNVVYNWGGRSTDGGAHEVNFVGNYYKPGAATTELYALNAQYENFPGTQKYYFTGNVMPGRFDVGSQDQGRRTTGTPDGYTPWVNAPFFPSYATVQTAAEAYKDVLSDVGMTQPVFDDHDARIIKETLAGSTTYKGSKSGKAGLPDNEADVGGFESYPTTMRDAAWDTDGDGLPDFWEKQIKSATNSPAGTFTDSNADPNADGYTQLDDYLIWMSKPHYFTTPGGSVSIDLAKLFAGYTTGTTYSSSAAVNGAVTISGKTATLQVTACGFASAKLTAKDSDGASKTLEIVAVAEGSSCP